MWVIKYEPYSGITKWNIIINLSDYVRLTIDIFNIVT